MKMARNRVFIVDDDAIVRDTVCEMLENNGYLTVMAESMETVLSLDTPVDTIIIDIFMPGLGGIEGITRVREKWPDAKIIAISGGWEGMDKEKTLQAAKRVGADSALAKPFMEEHLIEALAELEER
ncbi:MAG: response regulator [Rhodospirillales bacterium]